MEMKTDTGMTMIKDASKSLGVESHVLRYWEEELGLFVKRNSMGHRYYDGRDIKLFQEVKELRDRGFSLKDIKEGIEKQREKLKEEHELVEDTISTVATKEETGSMKSAAGELAEGCSHEKEPSSKGEVSRIQLVPPKKVVVNSIKNMTEEGVKANSTRNVGEEGLKVNSTRNVGEEGVKVNSTRNVAEEGVKVNSTRNVAEEELKAKNMDKQGKSELPEQLKVVDFKTAQLQTLMNKIVANALKENKDIITTAIKSELTTDVMRQFDAVMRENEEKEEERYRKLDETLRTLQRSNEEVAATKVKRGLFSKKRK